MKKAINKRKRINKASTTDWSELNAMIENVPMAIFLVDKEKKIRRANVAAEKFIGIRNKNIFGMRAGEALRCLNSFRNPKGCGFSPDCKDCLIRNTVDKTLKENKGFNKIEAKISVRREKAEKKLDLLVSTSLVNISNEQLSLVYIEDVTEQKKAEEKIQHLASFPKLNPNPVLEINASGQVTYANEAVEEILAEVGLQNKIDKFLPKDIREILKKLSRNKTDYFYREVKIGDKFLSETIHLTPQYNVVRIYAVDITERRLAQERVVYSSTHDALTGLYNRYFFENQLKKFRKQKNFSGCILMIDVDELKKTNDKLGHLAGDKLICESANLISSEVRKNDIVTRFGGDEFCVILPNTRIKEAQVLAERIQAKITDANKDRIGYMRLSLSIGTAYAQSGQELDSAIKIADENMYENKVASKI